MTTTPVTILGLTTFWGRHLASHFQAHGCQVSDYHRTQTPPSLVLFCHDPHQGQASHLDALRRLCDALRSQPDPVRIAYLSSVAICDYSSRAVRESARLAPHNDLEETLARAEELLQNTTRDTRGRISHTIFRLGDIYGTEFPLLPCPGLVNDYITRAQHNQNLPIPGLGSAKRSLLHVKDAAEAIVRTLLLPAAPTLMNLPGEASTVIDLALTIADHFNADATMGCDASQLSPHYSSLAGHRHLSSAIFRRTLDFTPQVKFKRWIASL